MPVFQGGRIWLEGQSDLESNAVSHSQMPACMVITPKGESNKAGKELKVSFNASFACARKKKEVHLYTVIYLYICTKQVIL